MELNGITHLVKDLEKARQFYEGLLGFQPGPCYEPTRWQSYQTPNGAYFAVGEAPGSFESVAFGVDDVEAIWERVKDCDQVVKPLNRTPWGTYGFVIRDPDGHLITFMQK